jgi:hypothetical protein
VFQKHVGSTHEGVAPGRRFLGKGTETKPEAKRIGRRAILLAQKRGSRVIVSPKW